MITQRERWVPGPPRISPSWQSWRSRRTNPPEADAVGTNAGTVGTGGSTKTPQAGALYKSLQKRSGGENLPGNPTPVNTRTPYDELGLRSYPAIAFDSSSVRGLRSSGNRPIMGTTERPNHRTAERFWCRAPIAETRVRSSAPSRRPPGPARRPESAGEAGSLPESRRRLSRPPRVPAY
jgi:hypothetical protein